ncbi:hypothetical protein STCU_09950 [Strigomonas culicis]|uniref:Uncharacterized protein n=1 Tax=Strigomonas culicis TaxID=28005 RepID=S9UVD9_9TRYP|nr:hypothetical protein STCU_09950 [Strigomonas culicis]|eukprot:EPY18476.1 hypothetical protein STCU_09950 [Strigomonas culicis]
MIKNGTLFFISLLCITLYTLFSFLIAFEIVLSFHCFFFVFVLLLLFFFLKCHFLSRKQCLVVYLWKNEFVHSVLLFRELPFTAKVSCCCFFL